VVKMGAEGALIRRGDEEVRVGVLAEARRVDTTGAGDFFAAGFLYGMSRGLSLATCGTIGSIAAGRVIEVAGTTLPEATWADIRAMVARAENGEVSF